MTVCGTIAAWNTLAQGWGNLATLAQLDWAFVSLPCLSALGTLFRYPYQEFLPYFSLSSVNGTLFLLLENMEVEPILDSAGDHQYCAMLSPFDRHRY
jgi:hypothetical protein